MPNPDKVFAKSFNEVTIGSWIFIIFLFSLAGTTFLAINSVQSGIVYAILLTTSLAGLFLLTLFKKNEDRPSEFIPLPFAKSFAVEVAMYTFGFFAGIISNLISVLTLGFSVASFTIPLFTGDIVNPAQTFSVAVLEQSVASKLFNIFFVAGVDETIIYSWILMVFGAVLGMVILRLISKEGAKASKSQKWVVLSIAFVFAILAFIGSHFVNDTYQTVSMFMKAGGFLAVSNATIYFFGVPLAFWVGYHQANNLMYLIYVLGFVAVLNGFLSLFGIIFTGIVLLLIFYWINNYEYIFSEMRKWWKS